MNSLTSELDANRITWNQVAHKFRGVCALPSWGPFDTAAEINLLGPLAGKTVLEIGCGSGHSLAYVARKGAVRAFGVDLSPVALAFAAELNQEEIESGRIQLIEAPMEQRLDLPPVDLVYSVYGLGWTLDLEQTLSNIASYLEPGGRLIFSGDHPLFAKARYEEGRITLHTPYLQEGKRRLTDWGDAGAYVVERSTSTVFRALNQAGFLVRDYLEPPPHLEQAPEEPGRYYSQAKLKFLPLTTIFVCEKPA